jgi:hypothetical protein
LIKFPHRQQIIKPPNLITGTHIELVLSRKQAHGLIKNVFINGHLAICLTPHQHQAIGLIGGKSKTQILLLQPLP